MKSLESMPEPTIFMHFLVLFLYLIEYKTILIVKTAKAKSSHHIYVVELSKRVWTESWRFRAANPQYNGVSECLYVGITSHTPKVRFQKHKAGARSKKGHKISSWYVEKYGLYLRPSLYDQHNPMSRVKAQRMEKDLSERLRRKGYAVWWN